MNLAFLLALVFCWSLSSNGIGLSPKVKLQTRRLNDFLIQLRDDGTTVAGERRDLDLLPDVQFTEDSFDGKKL